MKSLLIISLLIYFVGCLTILAQNNNDSTKTESTIKRLFKIDDTFCWVEIVGEEGKIFYEKGEGFTEIKFIKKTDDGRFMWEEYYQGKHTGTLVFYDEHYTMGNFTRHKDNKVFIIREYEKF